MHAKTPYGARVSRTTSHKTDRVASLHCEIDRLLCVGSGHSDLPTRESDFSYTTTGTSSVGLLREPRETAASSERPAPANGPGSASARRPRKDTGSLGLQGPIQMRGDHGFDRPVPARDRKGRCVLQGEDPLFWFPDYRRRLLRHRWSPKSMSSCVKRRHSLRCIDWARHRSTCSRFRLSVLRLSPRHDRAA